MSRTNRTFNISGGLTISQFQTISALRARLWHKDRPWGPNEWTVAVLGELGEFANELKKVNRDRDGLASNNARRESLGKELADTFAYLVLLAESLGINLESETISVFNKISAREDLLVSLCTCGYMQAGRAFHPGDHLPGCSALDNRDLTDK